MAPKKKNDNDQAQAEAQDSAVESHAEATERKIEDLNKLRSRMGAIPNAIGVTGASGSSVADATNVPAPGPTSGTGGTTNG